MVGVGVGVAGAASARSVATRDTQKVRPLDGVCRAGARVRRAMDYGGCPRHSPEDERPVPSVCLYEAYLLVVRGGILLLRIIF